MGESKSRVEGSKMVIKTIFLTKLFIHVLHNLTLYCMNYFAILAEITCYQLVALCNRGLMSWPMLNKLLWIDHSNW